MKIICRGDVEGKVKQAYWLDTARPGEAITRYAAGLGR
jgi:hypothetical protein